MSIYKWSSSESSISVLADNEVDARKLALLHIAKHANSAYWQCLRRRVKEDAPEVGTILCD